MGDQFCVLEDYLNSRRLTAKDAKDAKGKRGLFGTADERKWK
jgi:hypothetical protein